MSPLLCEGNRLDSFMCRLKTRDAITGRSCTKRSRCGHGSRCSIGVHVPIAGEGDQGDERCGFDRDPDEGTRAGESELVTKIAQGASRDDLRQVHRQDGHCPESREHRPSHEQRDDQNGSAPNRKMGGPGDLQALGDVNCAAVHHIRGNGSGALSRQRAHRA